MTPHALLTQAKQRLATGSGQSDKAIAICFALDRVTYNLPLRQRKAARQASNTLKDEIMAYLCPDISFRMKLLRLTTEQVQAARHAYIDKLIEEAQP